MFDLTMSRTGHVASLRFLGELTCKFAMSVQKMERVYKFYTMKLGKNMNLTMTISQMSWTSKEEGKELLLSLCTCM